MKIIDLFNKIANGEDVPKKIRYRDKIWEYNIKNQDYCDKNNKMLFGYLFDYIRTSDFINDEVEIIEEKNEIEKIIINNNTLKFPNGGGQWTARNMDKAFAIKINELIKEVNKLKDND